MFFFFKYFGFLYIIRLKILIYFFRYRVKDYWLMYLIVIINNLRGECFCFYLIFCRKRVFIMICLEKDMRKFFLVK